MAGLGNMIPIDVLRIGEALARPGMDTRTWFAAAVITAIQVDATGAKADVQILPFGRPETVALGVPGGGSGVGLHLPYSVGALVLVGFPDGNAEAGGAILCSLADRGQPVPQVVTDNPDDAALVAPANKNIRLVVSGLGKVAIIAELGHVLIGGEDLDTDPVAGEGVVLASCVDTFTGTTLGALGGASFAVFAKKLVGI